MRAMFVGSGDTDPAEVVLYGVSFPLNEWVDFDDPALGEKLKGNGHFVFEEEDPDAERKNLRQRLIDAGQSPHHRLSVERLQKMVGELDAQ